MVRSCFLRSVDKNSMNMDRKIKDIVRPSTIGYLCGAYKMTKGIYKLDMEELAIGVSIVYLTKRYRNIE